MKDWLINICLIVLLFIIAVNINWRVKDKFLELRYDLFNSNPEVYLESKIEDKLDQLKKIGFDDLEEEYLDYTKSNELKYKKIVNKLTYYVITRQDLNKRIVGSFRLKEFICKDDYYQDCVLNKRDEIICSFNKKIFFKTLELIEELDKLGYDKYGFRVVNGHRHPRYNEEIGGAKLSRHMKGEAVDIVIEDINQDGYADKADKDVVLDLLDRKIIGDEGGIGLYPGTDNVHYDVRGKKARWDSY